MQVEIGLWAVPLAVTVIGYWVSDRWANKKWSRGGDYSSIGNAAVALVSFGVWLIVSLIAWLIYALAT